MPVAPQSGVEGENLSATALFLMTEYMECHRPLLAALIAGKLLALERQFGPDSSLTPVARRLRHRWWQLAQLADAP